MTEENKQSFTVRKKKDIILVIENMRFWLENERDKMSEEVFDYLTNTVADTVDGESDSQPASAGAVIQFMDTVKSLVTEEEFYNMVKLTDNKRIQMWTDFWEVSKVATESENPE